MFVLFCSYMCGVVLLRRWGSQKPYKTECYRNGTEFVYLIDLNNEHRCHDIEFRCSNRQKCMSFCMIVWLIWKQYITTIGICLLSIPLKALNYKTRLQSQTKRNCKWCNGYALRPTFSRSCVQILRAETQQLLKTFVRAMLLCKSLILSKNYHDEGEKEHIHKNT